MINNVKSDQQTLFLLQISRREGQKHKKNQKNIQKGEGKEFIMHIKSQQIFNINI